MANITIRNLEDSIKSKLRLRAARHGRSMEEEARQILRAALTDKIRRSGDLFETIRRSPIAELEASVRGRRSKSVRVSDSRWGDCGS